MPSPAQHRPAAQHSPEDPEGGVLPEDVLGGGHAHRVDLEQAAGGGAGVHGVGRLHGQVHHGGRVPRPAAGGQAQPQAHGPVLQEKGRHFQIQITWILDYTTLGFYPFVW